MRQRLCFAARAAATILNCIHEFLATLLILRFESTAMSQRNFEQGGQWREVNSDTLLTTIKAFLLRCCRFCYDPWRFDQNFRMRNGIVVQWNSSVTLEIILVSHWNSSVTLEIILMSH